MMVRPGETAIVYRPEQASPDVQCSAPDELMYNSLTASQICSFLVKLRCSRDAFGESDAQPLGQANVQPLTS